MFFQYEERDTIEEDAIHQLHSLSIQELTAIIHEKDCKLKMIQSELVMRQQALYELEQYLGELEKDVVQLRQEKLLLKEVNQSLERRVCDLMEEKQAIIGHVIKQEEKEVEYERLLGEREGQIVELRSVLGEYEIDYKQLQNMYISQIHSRNKLIPQSHYQHQTQPPNHISQLTQIVIDHESFVVNDINNEQQLRQKDIVDGCNKITMKQYDNELVQRIYKLQEQIVELHSQVSKYQLLTTHTHSQQVTYSHQQQQYHSHLRELSSSEQYDGNIIHRPAILMNQLQMIQGFQHQHQLCLTTSRYKRLFIEQRHRQQTQRSMVSVNEQCSVKNNNMSLPYTERKMNCSKQQIGDKRSTSEDNITNQYDVVAHFRRQLQFANNTLFIAQSKLLHAESNLIEMQQYIDEQDYLLAQSRLQLTHTENDLEWINGLLSQQNGILQLKQLQIHQLHESISQRQYVHQQQLKQANSLVIGMRRQLHRINQLLLSVNYAAVQKDIIIQEKAYIIKQKNSIIKQKDDVIREKNDMISENETIITQLQQQLQTKQRDINLLQQQLTELKVSHSQYLSQLSHKLHTSQQALLMLQKRDNLVIDQMKLKIVRLMHLVEGKNIYIKQRQQSHMLHIVEMQTKLKQALINSGDSHYSMSKLNSDLYINIDAITVTDKQSAIVSPRRQKVINRTSAVNSHLNSSNRQLVFLQNAVTKHKQQILSLHMLLADKDGQIQSLKQAIKQKDNRHRELINGQNQNFVYESVSTAKQSTTLTVNHPPNSPRNKFTRTKAQTKPLLKPLNSPSTTIINSNSLNDLNSYYRQNILPRYLSRKKSTDCQQKVNN